MFWIIRRIFNITTNRASKKFSQKSERQRFLRRAVISKITKEQNGIIMSRLAIVINLKKIQEHRNSIFEKQKLKVSLFTLILKKIAEALMKHPKINSHSRKRKLVLFDNAHISFLIGSDKPDGGATIRTIQDVDQKPIKQVDSEMKALIKEAHEEEVVNFNEAFKFGSVVVDNIGSFGMEFGFAPLTRPFSLNIAVGRKKENGDAIFSVVFDGRWLEGMWVGRFLQDLKVLIEDQKQTGK